MAKTFTCIRSKFNAKFSAIILRFCEYIQHQKLYILVSFEQNIIFKQRTELTDRHSAENKSQEKQGFHLDAAQ